MTDEHEPRPERDHCRKTLSRSRMVLIGFLIVVAYFLFTEHQAHVIAFLPFLLLLACPLMHIFMHHGHGGHGGHDHNHRDSENKKGDS